MTARLLCVAALTLALAAAVWWPGVAVEAPAAGASAAPVDAAVAAPVVEADAPDRERVDVVAEGQAALSADDAGAGRVFTASVQGAPDGSCVDLLFGEPARPVVQRLRLRADATASWASGDRDAWPFAVDVGFATTGGSLVATLGEARAQLTAPRTCVLAIEVSEVDGLPPGEGIHGELRVPSAPAPANRWHQVGFRYGRAEVPAEAAGQVVELRVTTASGRSATGRFTAAVEAGARVVCALQLASDGGLPLRLEGLPSDLGQSRRSRVDLYRSNGDWVGRAPGRGTDYLAFVPTITPALPIGAEGLLEDDVFVLASRGDERWWGVLRGQRAVMAPCLELVRGRICDVDGRGVEGAVVELVPAAVDAVPGPRTLLQVRAGRDGAFVLRGPDPRRVPVALRVQATGERVLLPHDGPLLLRATL